MNTKQMIVSMLIEPIGHSIFDSGDFYGRSYDRNRKAIGNRDPVEVYDATPESWVRFDVRRGELEIDITKSVYHHCVRTLEYNQRLDRMLHRFARRDDQYYNGWPKVVEEFLKYLSNKGIEIAGGIYGEDEPYTENTYNGECLLSQGLQYTTCSIDRESIVILQIHGGCDSRGGYTDPRVFSADDDFSCYNNASIGCVRCGAAWYTDDGYHLYPANDEDKIEKFEVLDRDDFEDEDEYFAILNSVQEIPEEQDALPGFDRPKFVHDGNHVKAILLDKPDAYCPYCHGQLKA